jgi:sulfonate transport system ATP-binding protein
MSATPAVSIARLTRRYGDREILSSVNLSIAPGEFVALLGRSGSGKTTLLRALGNLDPDVEGSGVISAPDEISVAFQDARLLPWASVLGNVTLGFKVPDADALGRAMLAEVGLSGREQTWPHELSGGEQQRAALARSLVREPRLLLADEPFGALDALTRIRMHDLLRELWRRHRPSVLLVTHDVEEAIVLADRVIVLDRGHLVLDQSVDIAGPRSPRSPRFQELREILLGALGVENPPLAA